VTGSAGSIVEHRYLVKRVRFPAEIIPAASPLAESITHLALVALTAIACAAAGYGGTALLAVPYFYACAIVLALGVGLWLAATAVLVRDVLRGLPSVLTVWFWLTPVAWAAGGLPGYARDLLVLNPAAYVVSGYRHALMPQAFGGPSLIEGVAFWLLAIGLLVSGSAYFRRLRPAFWESL
jgi:teichoic acid transport system permease protein